MGLLSMLITPQPNVRGDDHQSLGNTITAMAAIDGNIDPAEVTLLKALAETIPQLKGKPLPAKVGRKELLEQLAALPSRALRRQCFVLAVEVALASGHVNESEDQFIDRLQKALDIDLAFAREAIEVIACKYARAEG
jgi:tellurite resistance protein